MAEEGVKRGWSISGMIGGGAALVTALAAVVGMLNQLGFVENHASSPASAKAPASLSADAPSETAPVAANKSRSGNEAAASSATFATSQSSKMFNLTGAWRDTGMGACHLILQTGLNLKVTNFYPDSTKIMSQGEGTIAGSHVELHLKRGRAEFQLSSDGKVLQGSMQRASGTRPSMWQYIGTSCSTPG